MIRKVLFVIILISFTNSLVSQELFLDRNYFANNFYHLNPAAAGIEGEFISQLTVSKKWAGIAGSPAIQSFSNSIKLGGEGFYDEEMFLQKPLFNIAERVGIGVTLFSEASGPLRNTGFYLHMHIISP